MTSLHELIRYHKLNVKVIFKKGKSTNMAIGVLEDIEYGFVLVVGNTGSRIIPINHIGNIDLFN